MKKNKKAKTKLYVIMTDGNLGYVDHICKCEKCKERGMWEVFINTLNNEYLDCIRFDELNKYIGFCSNNKKILINCYFNRYFEKILKNKIEEIGFDKIFPDEYFDKYFINFKYIPKKDDSIYTIIFDKDKKESD
ncbi:hypothetical protein CWE04_11170 [Thomasclavelia cocleata]|uniref:Uncharacterized protein n=1 Tax=Thomasclavelia cocleata TaxID=69824 RepID=A0A1I0BDQ3_9FIRM|nr:hypothetical protein [Thomasclavelia cocleata]MCR1959913.1 hypothetical protein [Thomasclavelia cocleata]PJN79772.1 hypothetical protein CWE04_11170 [Thomasclavelia cocleata]SET04967.1 hypothetical protein SAMN04489758_10180 [Thomasclavelia cocleata]